MAALLLLTLFSLSNIILSLAENINIDCGASGPYVDSENVTWFGDKGFVTTDESIEILGNITNPINTLRYFSSDQPNCYSNIPVTKGGKTLVKTLFYYGNYDDKSSPPSFNVFYDEKYLDSVVIPDVEPPLSKSEVIFAPASEKISVCLIRTSPSDDPFISSIQVYNLDAGMYDDLGPDEVFILRQRNAFGAKEIISDPYGRLWFPSNNPNLSELTSSASSIDITGASNKPPEIVMSSSLSAADLKLVNLALPLTGLSVYLALYFSEPRSRNQRRSFNVSLNTTQVSSGPIVPVFGKATQLIIRDAVALGSQVVFQPTDDSILPPIINAFELYWISNALDVSDNVTEESVGGKYDSEGSGGTTWTNNVVEGILDAANINRGKRKNKLPLILGSTFASAFVACAAIFYRKCANTKPDSNTLPTTSTTGPRTETGVSPLVGLQLASDATNPVDDEPGSYDIDDS